MSARESQNVNEILLRALKYDRSPHLEWRAELIDESASRKICLTPPGTECIHHGRGFTYAMDHYALCVFLRDEWFNAMFDFKPDGSLLMIYCNVTLPYSVDSEGLSWVDLDLDVVMPSGSNASVVDVDEFEAHSCVYGYAASVVERARATADMLLDREKHGEFPFWPGDLDAVLARLRSGYLRSRNAHATELL